MLFNVLEVEGTMQRWHFKLTLCGPFPKMCTNLAKDGLDNTSCDYICTSIIHFYVDVIMINKVKFFVFLRWNLALSPGWNAVA